MQNTFYREGESAELMFFSRHVAMFAILAAELWLVRLVDLPPWAMWATLPTALLALVLIQINMWNEAFK
jgi:hypothetical protein